MDSDPAHGLLYRAASCAGDHAHQIDLVLPVWMAIGILDASWREGRRPAIRTPLTRNPVMTEGEGIERAASGRAVACLFGPYRYDRANQVLSRDGSDRALPPRALKALRCLLERAGEVVSKQELVDEVWSGGAVNDGSCSDERRSVENKIWASFQFSPVFCQTQASEEKRKLVASPSFSWAV